MNNLNDNELIAYYGKIVKAMRERGIIRTKNVVGDLGERFAIDYYTQKPELESLSDTKPSEKSIDAIGEHGNRYTIKSVTGNVTGVFYGLPPKDSEQEPTQLFDFLLIVVFSDSYEVKNIYEITWQQFLVHKKWHNRMEAWNIPVNKTVKLVAKVVYSQSAD